MISDIPRIKISGITHPVYALDYQWGGADNPSSVTVHFVNKNGIYATPSLNTSQVTNIQCGDVFTFTGYPVSYSQKNQNGAKSIEITYWDESVRLDKIFVGLKGVHGAAPRPIGNINLDGTTTFGQFGEIVLVGNYVDPCSGVSDEYIDPCNPCTTTSDFQSISDSNYQQQVDCDTARFTNILDVNYSFLDLVAALGSKGIVFYNTPAIKNEYYGRYTGTAREVLKAWCNDLGFTFIWDNGVRFIDLKIGISINDTDLYDDCALISSSVSESIENTHTLGNIFYFGAEGELKSYNCAASPPYKLSLLPITLTDLFFGSAGTAFIQKYYENILGLQIACLAAKHSRIMRDLLLLYEFYDVNLIKNEVNTSFPLLGLTVKEVWDVGGSQPGSGVLSNGEELFWNYIPESIRQRASHFGASICMVEYNKQQHDDFYEMENNLSNDFMGQYWISFFTRGESYTYQAPDGTVDYFAAGSPVTLPFSDMLPESVADATNFMRQIINSTAQLNKEAGSVGDVTTTTPNTYNNSFLLMNRSADWSPTSVSEDVKKFDQNYEPIYLFNIEPFKIEGAGDTLKKNQFYMLIFNKPGTFTLVDRGEREHPTERTNKNLRSETDTAITYYGLRSAISQTYELQLQTTGDAQNPGWTQRLGFYLPVQSHNYAGSAFPGYTILATLNSSNESEQKVFVPRKEVILGDIPLVSSESVGVIINFKDISSTIQSIIAETSTSCGYDVGAIQNLLTNYKVNSARIKEIKRMTRTYSIGGVPNREVSITDGLSSLSIRYDSQNGISTDLSFSNSPPISKSDTVVDQEFEKNILKRLLKRKVLNSDDKIQL